MVTQNSEQHNVSKHGPRNRRYASRDTGSGKAIAQRNPPLHPRVRAMSEAKIAKLREQIAVVKRGHLTTPSE